MPRETDIRVLLIEDDEIDAESVMRQLGRDDTNFVTTHVMCLADALAHLKEKEFHIALLDLGLPDSAELQGVYSLREAAPHLPILVLTGLDDQNRASQAVRAGAQDYLVKGKIDQEVLVRSIRYAMSRQQIQNEAVINLDALEASEFRFRRLYEAMFEGMIIHGGDKVIDVNGQFASMFGYDIEDLVGKNIYDLLEPNSAPIVRDHITNRSEDMYEALGRRQNGETFPIEIVARNMVYDDVHMRVAVVRDITERRDSVTQIRKLSQAVEQSANMVIVTDNQGVIEYVNPQFSHITGYDPKDVIGRKPSLLKSGTTSLQVYQDLWQTISSGATWQGELFNKTKSGENFWISASISPVRDDADCITHYVAIQEDITQKKRTLEELAELNTTLEKRVDARTRELEETNRELEAFAYSVSHDLQAPLRSVDGFSAILLEDYDELLPDTGQDYLQRVRAGALRMKRLIDDMLNFSRQTRGALKKESVDLAVIAEEVFEDLKAQSPDRKVDIQISDDLIVQADKGMMRVVLENLLGNAWKFTQGVSPVEIIIGRDGKEPPCIFIQDNGAGFDTAHADNLFAPFKRLHTEEEFPGMGIGLATVKRIIHRHGGQIWAESSVGEGATFFMSL